MYQWNFDMKLHIPTKNIGSPVIGLLVMVDENEDFTSHQIRRHAWAKIRVSTRFKKKEGPQSPCPNQTNPFLLSFSNFFFPFWWSPLHATVDGMLPLTFACKVQPRSLMMIIIMMMKQLGFWHVALVIRREAVDGE